MMKCKWAFIYLAVAFFLGCPTPQPLDAGPQDAARQDSDSGPPENDGGPPDGGSTDGGSADAGSMDGGPPDGAAPDDGGLGRTTWQQVPLRTKAQEAAGLKGGEGTQNIYTIKYAPSNPNIVYMANDVGQVWKSSNGGSNWARSHRGFKARGALSVMVSPFDENLVFASGAIMSAATLPPSPADGIYRSTDGGEHWGQVLRTGYYRLLQEGAHFAFRMGGVVYGATFDQGLVKSTDRGTTWTTLYRSGGPIMDVHVHPTMPEILYLVTQGAVLRIRDEGGSATLLSTASPLPRSPASIVIDQQHPENIYALMFERGVFKSTNGGLNFSPANNGIIVAAGKRATHLAISPADGNVLFVYFQEAPQDFFFSHDGAATWRRPSSTDERNAFGYVSGSQEHPDTNTAFGWGTGPIAAHPTNRNIALATGAFYHIKKTTDGGINWRYSNDGYTGGAAGNGVASFSFDKANRTRFAIFLVDYGGYITDDDGSTFRPLLVPWVGGVRSNTTGAIDALSNSQLIVTSNGGWYNQILAQSTNNGVNWTFPTDGSGNTLQLGYTFIDFHPQNNNIIYANAFKGVRNPATGALVWTRMSSRVEAIFDGNGDHVYSFWERTVYRSTDAGLNWNTHSVINNTETSAPISALAIDPTNEDRLYAVAGTNGLYVWSGTAWIKKGAGDGFTKDTFDRYGTVTVAIDPRSPNIVYAGNTSQTLGQSNGVFRSTNYGMSWENVSYNLGPEINVVALRVNPHNSYVYLGSYMGTWRLPPPGPPGP